MGKGPLYFLVLFILFLTPIMVYYPHVSLQGAQEGLSLWFNVALPALFPFMVVAEIIVGLGLPRLLGTLLEPLMRPLFRLPGSAGVVVAVGFTTGFPIGAIMTARLIQDGLLTPEEGERLVPFTNNSSPLFMLGAVGAGLFGQPELGVFLAISHYGANLVVGLLYAHSIPNFKHDKTYGHRNGSWGKLISEWRLFLSDTRPVGEILGQAIVKGMNNLAAIGGYLMFFTVAFRLLTASGILSPVITAIATFLTNIDFDSDLAPGIAAGLMEMTIGCQQLAAAHAPLSERLLGTAFVLAWSGISIQAQVATFLANTGVRLGRYLLGRLLQGVLSVLFLFLLLPFLPISIPATEFIPANHLDGWLLWPGSWGTAYFILGAFILIPLAVRKFIHLH